MESLEATLDHIPRPLKFGTSGRRGDVLDLTQLEIYVNVRAELEYLTNLRLENGGIIRRQKFYIAHDLRPSSTRFVAEQGGRGEIAQAVERAVADAGFVPINLGAIPTPALTAYAISLRCGSIMVTGSHIPFERNGYKTNSSTGELTKEDEAPITRLVEKWREGMLTMPCGDSPFRADGSLKGGARLCGKVDDAGSRAYLSRFLEFFAPGCLTGLSILVFQHSAVGRQLLVEVLERLGAVVRPVGLSETFIPIDTEAIDVEILDRIRLLAQTASSTGARFDAVVSTDGDSDRPLVVGIDYAEDGSCACHFFPGDLVGILTAKYLDADTIVVPVSVNDAIDRDELGSRLAPKTRIGSPYVIAGMEAACAKGSSRVCGWEANGGFLTATDFDVEGRVLTALPTRDAFLPIIVVLSQMSARKVSMATLFDELPLRFSSAALLKNFPRTASLKIVEALTPKDGGMKDSVLRDRIHEYFTHADGFGNMMRIDCTDGVRIFFSNGDVAHIRPSGNADELRIYAVADSRERALAIASAAVAEPDGILRKLARNFGLLGPDGQC